MFYLMSLFTGMLECGWICYGFMKGYPLWRILSFPLTYQAGNMFPKPFVIGRKLLPVLTAVSCAGSMAVTLMDEDSIACNVVTLVVIASLSAELQTLRGSMKAGAGKVLKRVCRVAGFALSPLAAFFPGTVLIIISAVAAIETVRQLAAGPDSGRNRPAWFGTAGLTVPRNTFGITMLFHQLHYFLYAYAVLAYMMSRAGGSRAEACVTAMLMFCATWVTYLSLEPLLKHTSVPTWSVFVIGHLTVTMCLLLLSTDGVRTTAIGRAVWILAGLGGGSVYTINQLASEHERCNRPDFDVIENIGHLFGAAAATVTALLIGDKAMQLLPAVSAISAILTVFSAVIIRQASSVRRSRT